MAVIYVAFIEGVYTLSSSAVQSARQGCVGQKHDQRVLVQAPDTSTLHDGLELQYKQSRLAYGHGASVEKNRFLHHPRRP